MTPQCTQWAIPSSLNQTRRKNPFVHKGLKGIFLPFWSRDQRPVEFGKKAFESSKLGNLLQSKRTADRHFERISCFNCPSQKFMKICIKMWKKTCFHSHFHANFHASVTLLFLFGFSRNFLQSVEQRDCERYTPFWEVFARFLIGKGLIFGSKSGLGKFLVN